MWVLKDGMILDGSDGTALGWVLWGGVGYNTRVCRDGMRRYRI